MNSTTKGLLFIVFGVLSLLWFAYDVIGYLSRGGVAPGDNPALEFGMTGLKLVMVISFFVSAISAFRKKG
ncbi:MAG TPA: hypothetical protein VIL74_13665 [Pyrinomonadaceae bacterium]|jgi:hypothetical protein